MHTLNHTRLNLFNGLFSITTWVSWYQKGITSPDLNEARDDGVLEWHQLYHTQSAPHFIQTITLTPHHSIFTGWMLSLMHNQQCQSTEDTSTEGTM